MLGLPAIRLATPADAQAIAALSRDAIERGLHWRYTPARILAAIRSRTTNVAVAHGTGALHAFAIMDYGDTTAHLVLLGVQTTQRRRGLGARLLTWLEDAARIAGIERVDVECRADNPGAIAFYRRCGYRVQGVFPHYYEGRIDAVRLAKTLLQDAPDRDQM
ncbi:GNAT family acetyltransferase [Lysobacter dokdonensis DS-58]|uniref:GNAT family acetyltransferase n=1 Tax=Lysobacter dokdonensis DS-58 TaxID=1300345 RepID=A0A0A2X6C3_9GAMM|nr:GNAT family N-acetyltransferase [Lysobacter dokdonensis]KGQ20779.1 GNAT family acetyltransferase [Lysobacter dokdonensis DS-58]